MKKAKIILLILLSSFLSGCYEDFINIYSDFSPGIYNEDSTQIFFFHELKAGQPPRGISRFPDGGTHNMLFKKITLYSYDIKAKKLKTVFNFGDIPSQLSSWREELNVSENTLVFSINPLGGWQWTIDHTSIWDYQNCYNKYAGIFKAQNGNTKRLTKDGIDPKISTDLNRILYQFRDSLTHKLILYNLFSDSYDTLMSFENLEKYDLEYAWKNKNEIFLGVKNEWVIHNLHSHTAESISKDSIPADRKINIGEIDKLLSEIPIVEFGLYLDSVWPISRKKYFYDVSHMNGNLDYRKAIIQKFGNELSEDEIQKILNDLDKFIQQQEGSKKMQLEIFSKETKDLLKNLQK